jgi:gamma-glutamylcyclotransferase
MKPTVRLYFAYGSNLDPFQMWRRCPDASHFAIATLPNHALAFAGYSANWGGGVATIVQAKNVATTGVLYTLTEEDIARLDRFEGCPYAYRRARKVVIDDDGKRRVAEVYLQERAGYTPPSRSYAEVLRREYKRLGFDLRALKRAIRGMS